MTTSQRETHVLQTRKDLTSFLALRGILLVDLFERFHVLHVFLERVDGREHSRHPKTAVRRDASDLASLAVVCECEATW